MDRVRVAFYILLFANLAYLAWSQWVDVPSQAAVADPVARLPRLKLIGEDAIETTPPATLAQCISVGPFDDLSSATRGAEVLRNKGFNSRQREQVADGPEGYWVYIGGLRTPDVAKLALESLRNDGIQEATVLQPSDDERRISVGLFTQRDQAYQRVQEVRRLGFNAQVAARRLPGTLYWVDVAVDPQDGTLPTQDLYPGPASAIGARPCPEGSPPPGASPDEQPPGHRSMGRRGATAVASIPR